MEMKSFVRANIDRVVAVGLAVVGVIAIVVGWVGVSGTGLAAEQIPYVISGGIGGIVLVALGCTAWVSADLQDEWRRLDAIEGRLEELAPDRPLAPATEVVQSNGVAPKRRTRKLVPSDAQA